MKIRFGDRQEHVGVASTFGKLVDLQMRHCALHRKLHGGFGFARGFEDFIARTNLVGAVKFGLTVHHHFRRIHAFQAKHAAVILLPRGE